MTARADTALDELLVESGSLVDREPTRAIAIARTVLRRARALDDGARVAEARLRLCAALTALGRYAEAGLTELFLEGNFVPGGSTLEQGLEVMARLAPGS